MKKVVTKKVMTYRKGGVIVGLNGNQPVQKVAKGRVGGGNAAAKADKKATGRYGGGNKAAVVSPKKG
jgi:hypothetical protein